MGMIPRSHRRQSRSPTIRAGDLLSVNGVLPGDIAASAYVPATGVLTLTSAGAATLAQWQAALHQVEFSNSNPAPVNTARDITVVVNDGTEQSSIAHASIILDVPPGIDGLAGDSASFAEGGAPLILDQRRRPASRTPTAPTSTAAI